MRTRFGGRAVCWLLLVASCSLGSGCTATAGKGEGPRGAARVFDTPEQTMEVYFTAARAEDYALQWSCFLPHRQGIPGRIEFRGLDFNEFCQGFFFSARNYLWRFNRREVITSDKVLLYYDIRQRHIRGVPGRWKDHTRCFLITRTPVRGWLIEDVEIVSW